MKYIINYMGKDQNLQAELRQIAAAISNLTEYFVPIVRSEPEKPEQGQILYAETAFWNPGAGTGMYFYDGAAWIKFGAAAGGSGATQLNELTDVSSSTTTNRFALMANGSNFASRALVEADISDLGVYLTDAPSDGLDYIRRDGAWEVAAAAGGNADDSYAYFLGI